MTLIRTRWAAIGAAVAVTLGAGGVSLGQAAIGSGDKPVFVAIEPCRLVDTRPGDANVGGRTQPLGADDTLTLQVTGSTGDCTSIPAGATAAAMNVTAIQGSTRSYLTLYPADADLPLASNLNWNGGDPPTPNKVDVALSPSGAVKITNNAGTVHVAADLVGYYTDHHHDDRYYTKNQIDALVEPDTILVPASAFATPSPWTHGGWFVERPAGTNTCVSAPIDVAESATITSFELHYESASVSVVVQLRQMAFVEGSYDQEVVTTGSVVVPGVGPNEFYADVVTLPVIGDGQVLADTPQSLEVCSAAQVAVYGIKVHLG